MENLLGKINIIGKSDHNKVSLVVSSCALANSLQHLLTFQVFNPKELDLIVRMDVHTGNSDNYATIS